MSAELHRTIRCDAHDNTGGRCGTEWGHPVGARSFPELRRFLRERGWRRRDGRDLCPDCATKETA
ncbi:hypothetical protein ACIOJ9_34655 [Streptomyces sp. NPDC088175]|uniref:hypothetical protein n=1 Tax=unclassified Streptomyces TaxID=2593676 RepID=UPI0038118864